jgi:hypothetical protein
VGATATAEIYNPVTGIWTFTGSMAGPRITQKATLLANGKVLVAGGFLGDNTPLATAELYDPEHGCLVIDWEPELCPGRKYNNSPFQWKGAHSGRVE